MKTLNENNTYYAGIANWHNLSKNLYNSTDINLWTIKNIFNSIYINSATNLCHNVFPKLTFLNFFNCYLAAPWPTLGHYREGGLTHPMLIKCALHICPEGHLEPRNKVESLSLAECLAGFKLGTFQFWLQCLNPLGHSPLNGCYACYFLVF